MTKDAAIMRVWSGPIQVFCDDHSDGWDFTLSATICNQLYRERFLYTYRDVHAHGPITATEAIGRAIVQFGNYVLGYERLRRRQNDSFDGCWRD